MALVACSECGKEVSDKAPSCPGCGVQLVGSDSAVQPKIKRKTHPVTWAVLFLFLAGVGWYTQTRGYKEQSLPPIPIEVQTRQALLGPGLVLRVNNTSATALMALVKLYNPTTNESKSFRLDLTPNGSGEIGHREGWTVTTVMRSRFTTMLIGLGRAQFRGLKCDAVFIEHRRHRGQPQERPFRIWKVTE